jgi:prevent-host-death family protein
MGQRVINDEVKIFKVSDLNQDTAGVLKQINEGGRPAVVTKHGRFIAMITPLEGRNVEGLLVDAVLRSENTLDAATTLSTDELARALNVNLH